MIYSAHGKTESRAAYSLFRRGAKPRWGLATTGAKRRPNSPDERKEGII